MRVAIIGSAGRNKDGERVNKKLYSRLVGHARHFIASLGIEDCTLVSGGAAFVDHVAVTLHLIGVSQKLVLYLPAQWDGEKYCGNSDSGYANYLHYCFSEALGEKKEKSLETIGKLISVGNHDFEHHFGKGFKERNLDVAKSDILMAYTFNKGGPKPRSGTLHTWNHSDAKKYHFNLGEI